jgi:PST family polysaccharide transporter
MIYSILVSVFRLCSALLLNKGLIVYFGSAGLIAYGNYLNFMQLYMVIFTLGMLTSSITVTAKHSSNYKFTPASILFLVCFSLFIISNLTVLFFDSYGINTSIKLTETINVTAYSFIFMGFSFSVKTITYSFLNGLGKTRLIACLFASDIVIIATLFLTVDGIILFLLLISLVSFFQSIIFLLIVRFKFHFKRLLYFIGMMRVYAIMAIIPTIFVPLVLLLIRKDSETLYGEEFAGIIQGAWRLGDAAITSFAGIISMYFLPKFSRASHSQAVSDIVSYLKYIIPVFLFFILLFNLTAELWVSLLLTDSMLSELNFFRGYVTFSFVKVLCMFLGLHLVSHSNYKVYILSELVFIFTYYISFKLFLFWQFGFYSVMYSYIISVSLMLIVLTAIVAYYRKR